MTLIKTWTEKFHDKNFRVNFAVTFILLIITLISLTNFLIYNETRSGSIIDDPLLNLFEPVDVTWLTFIIIYAGLITGLYTLAQNPVRLVTALQAYIIMIIIRIISMYSLPLEPPVNMIILEDPLVAFFGTGEIYIKDLFFSGHTSTMFLLFLTAEAKKLRMVFLILTILVGICVIVQHVHYSIDVIAAPIAAYAGYKGAILLNKYL